MRANVSYFDPRLYSVADVCRMVGQQARVWRLARSLGQADVAKAVSVTRTTIVRFETTGKVGFDVVVGVAIALGAEAELPRLFAQAHTRSIDEIMSSRKPRSRARARRRP